MDEARRRLLRDTSASGRPPSDLVLPEHWPVLTGSRCFLRVLTEEDGEAWRADEDDRHFGPHGISHTGPGDPPDMEIRLRRVAWALGGGLRHWGIWTVPDGALAGGVELKRGRVGARIIPTEVSWVVFREFYSVELTTEAIELATRWALDNLDPHDVVAFFPDTEPVDERVLDAAGFRFDGPPEPWEAGLRRYRFDGS